MGILSRWKFMVILAMVVGVMGIGAVGQAQEKKAPAKAATEKKAAAVAPPIGKARTDKDFSKDISDLLFGRRVAVSDLPGGVAFKSKDCMRCHENEPGVEGQIFYGNPDFKKDVNWPNYIGNAEKKIAPTLKYSFFETHKKRAKLTPQGDLEQRLKQNQ